MAGTELGRLKNYVYIYCTFVDTVILQVKTYNVDLCPSSDAGLLAFSNTVNKNHACLHTTVIVRVKILSHVLEN